MIPRRVRFAILLAFICHGLFILTARYRLSYDAYTHMLFADHYASDWFSLWEARWYTGFEVVSYPPLIHQLIAIFVPLIGFDAAYALILWLVTTLYPLGIYTFSRNLRRQDQHHPMPHLPRRSCFPFMSPRISLVNCHFWPPRFLHYSAQPQLQDFFAKAKFQYFVLAISITATTMAAHHATLLFQPFLILRAYHLSTQQTQLEENFFKACRLSCICHSRRHHRHLAFLAMGYASTIANTHRPSLPSQLLHRSLRSQRSFSGHSIFPSESSSHFFFTNGLENLLACNSHSSFFSSSASAAQPRSQVCSSAKAGNGSPMTASHFGQA